MNGNPCRALSVRGGRVVFLDLDRIDWIEAEGNYVRLHDGSESYLQRDTMANVMERLQSLPFGRA